MSKRKIKTTLKDLFGKQVTVPYDGTINVAADGTVEVSNQAADVLLTIVDDWEEIAGSKVPKVGKQVAADPKATDEPKKDEKADVKPVDINEIKQTLEMIDQWSLDELNKIAESLQLKGYKIFAKKEKALRTFVHNKLEKLIPA
jgi:hypothetical protein